MTRPERDHRALTRIISDLLDNSTNLPTLSTICGNCGHTLLAHTLFSRPDPSDDEWAELTPCTFTQCGCLWEEETQEIVP